MIAIKQNGKVKYVTANEYHGMLERGEIKQNDKKKIPGKVVKKVKKYNKK